MPAIDANGITIEYEIEGPADGPLLLLIHGLGAQLIRWPRGLCERFVAAGFRVLRMDNRDVGLSTHLHSTGLPDLAAAAEAVRDGLVPAIPYTLSDMALDAIGLLDALGIASAHVVGVSLGGMIAQVLAIEHPARVRSLAIIMSHSGNPNLPGSDQKALDVLTAQAPNPGEHREAYIAHQVHLNRVLGSPAYPAPEAELRDFAARSADRAFDPAGNARQFAASRFAAERRASLRTIKQPTLVIHGADDMLIPPEGGEDIARHIPQSWFLK